MAKYQLTPVVAGCVIQDDGKYLLVQEKQQKAHGLWNLPAGHVDEGETFEEAAIREAYEETGFTVELGEKLPVVHQAIDRPVLHAYKARILSGELRFDPDELLAAQWFTLQEIEQLHADGKLRNVWVSTALSKRCNNVQD